MIISERLHSLECAEEVEALIYQARSSLNPSLFLKEEKLFAEDVVWIEGTVTVSF